MTTTDTARLRALCETGEVESNEGGRGEWALWTTDRVIPGPRYIPRGGWGHPVKR